MEANQSQLFLCYYGDDFTGSTDSMEALTSYGIRTALFLKVPEPDFLASRFPDLQCFGVAGVGRQMTNDEMDRELRPILERLKQFNTPIVHYKMCSTFDSSPAVGSIGKVVDIGRELFSAQPYIPLLIGAPVIKRYTVFGNLFAAVDQATYRLDRHPTMSKHPVTPMNEADLRVHLGRQTSAKIDLMDILELTGDADSVQERYEAKLEGHPDVLLFDVLDDGHLLRAGEIIWNEALRIPQFVIGSSGVEYALGAHFRQTDLIPANPQTIGDGAAEQLLVISGSCSPVTEGQIQWALANGFKGIRISSEGLIDPRQQEAVSKQAFNEALRHLRNGENLIIYTALGPDDPTIRQSKKLLASLGFNSSDSGKLLGQQLGRLARELVENTSLRRISVAGGDTSGFVIQELGIFALDMSRPIDPGGPLCRIYSDNPRFDGMEIAVKGGQVGAQDYFGKVRRGKA